MGMGLGTRTSLSPRLADAWSHVWQWTLFAGGVAAGAYLLLDRGIANGAVTAAAIGVLLIGLVLTGAQPMAIPLIATPALFVVERMGLGGGDLTVSDAALAAACATAVFLGDRDLSPPMKALLRLNLVYQFATLFTVIVNPFVQNTIEWVHAWLLISGALITGWAIGRAGKARIAFVLMHLVAATIAVGVLIAAVPMVAAWEFTGVYPQWPWPMHKNFAGGALAFVAFLAYLNPDWAALPKRWARASMILAAVGLLLTQSRQAMIGLLVALLIHVVRQGAAKHWVLISAITVPGVVLIVQSVVEQIESQNRFNSANQRLEWIRQVYALWKESPLFGHGLRYWYVTPTSPFQPPQAELEVVASAGLVGLLGFGIMWLGIVVVLWRLDPRFGMLALGSVLARIVQAQFDLFWVSAQVSIPFVIAGICLGAQALAVSRGESSDYRNTRGRKINRNTHGGGDGDPRLLPGAAAPRNCDRAAGARRARGRVRLGSAADAGLPGVGQRLREGP
ncbi:MULTISPECIES: O-antigen ligase family protein [Microbacterium]|uniref:O-antigen ligase family protein n=1 Tax=Microbacterium TaxID=33882 RepID=UPI00217E6D92|nr:MULTISPECIES: O-antigen ligase family protein [Microbacterium]